MNEGDESVSISVLKCLELLGKNGKKNSNRKDINNENVVKKTKNMVIKMMMMMMMMMMMRW